MLNLGPTQMVMLSLSHTEVFSRPPQLFARTAAPQWLMQRRADVWSLSCTDTADLNDGAGGGFMAHYNPSPVSKRSWKDREANFPHVIITTKCQLHFHHQQSEHEANHTLSLAN